MAMAELYCKHSDNPSKEFVGNLNEEARNKIESMYSMKRLILNHTMFVLAEYGLAVFVKILLNAPCGSISDDRIRNTMLL